MININKFINTSLTLSNNIFNDLFIPLNKRTGFINGQSPIVPIYFYRYIGIPKSNEDYYTKIDLLNKKMISSNVSYLRFLSTIPFENNPQITTTIQNMWNSIDSEKLIDENIQYIVKSLISSKLIPSINNSLINTSLEESLISTLKLYIKLESNINVTKLKNFSIKLVLWITKFIPNLFKNFNIPRKITMDIINPKILYVGDIKKHEIYFLIFLSKIGCDILYLNSPNECDFSQIDPSEKHSKLIALTSKESLDISKLNISKVSTIANCSSSICTSSTLSIDTTNVINSITKTSSNIFEDITTSLNQRTNFSGGSSPTIPCYFYRYIGICDNKAEYFNNLYNLDKKLQKCDSLYMKFLNEIPLESNIDLLNKTSSMWKKLLLIERESTNNINSNTLVNNLITLNAFPNLREKTINSSILKSFYTVLKLYMIDEKHLNLSKIKNFTLKILMWIYKYVPNLFKNFDYLKTSNEKVYNPKILYYGEIKKHEAYFLIFLSLMGCDILYVNSKEDLTFSGIHNNNDFSKVITLSNTCKIEDFPLEELLSRHETVAFKASTELENVIYNEEDGIFKPWQFEEYTTYPLTLKTTYDELKLLWNEECRIRSGFKIENGTVHVPNLFAKISGVNSDLNLYWNDLKTFKNAKDTLFIYEIPHIHDNYSNYDLYSLNYCFKNGILDKESLLKHRLYKFSYLKTPLQNVIIDKINLLLKFPIFKNSVDDEFKLKILITILNIDKDILELIQKFDYPFNIPKIVIYHNTENSLSNCDVIVLTFLNMMCFDIAIFTPTGYNDIEANINENFYDIHKLEDIKFNLNIPNLNSIKKIKDRSSSFWSNLFK